MMISARRLLHWGDLEERRRRRARPGPAGWPPALWGALGGALLAGEVVRSLGGFGDAARGDADPIGASRLWLAVLIAGHVLVIFGAPFRMFWRRDAAMLGRMPLRGKALFGAALVRTARATAVAALPCALGALAFGPWGSWDIAARHLALVAVAILNAALLGPAAAMAAGAVVASDKAEALLASMSGGEFRPPKTSWLGILPGLVATGLVLLMIACGDWVVGAPRTAVGAALPLLVAAAGVPVAAYLWAAARADHVMLVATREVAALDQERLAHVDLTTASRLDRVVMNRLDRGAALVFDKDARLLRRRFPMPYFLGFLGVAVLWILAAARPDDLLVWSAVIAGCLGAYGVIMARRLVAPPTENLAFLRTLPVGAASVARAKRVHAVSWIATYPLLGAIPCAVRAAEPVVAAIVLGLIIAAATAAAGQAAGRLEG